MKLINFLLFHFIFLNLSRISTRYVLYDIMVQFMDNYELENTSVGRGFVIWSLSRVAHQVRPGTGAAHTRNTGKDQNDLETGWLKSALPLVVVDMRSART